MSHLLKFYSDATGLYTIETNTWFISTAYFAEYHRCNYEYSCTRQTPVITLKVSP